MTSVPPNTYKPGTKLTVGSHDVSIIKYISQGGFAHVYTCNIEPSFQGSNVACLKRVLVPSKWQLNLLRQEVDAMKRLRGNPTIVSYIDSHASRVMPPQGFHSSDKEQQYEVFLLMEYCANNGLIDFMNSRLSNRLTEPEILVIMKDITTAVAMCHHLQPPLLHRDIKIENVLLDERRTYKLCDFGSAVPYAPVSKSNQEFQQLKDDIMQHTTPQYRAPEMIDLTRAFPIDNKSDIWALGCFLYKLCYYTTPFESSRHTSLQDLEQSILNCSHTLKIPFNTPGVTFSPRMKNIIKCCLREDPRRRPSATQLLEEICSMMNVKVPNVIPASVVERPTVPIKHNHQQNTNDNNNSTNTLQSSILTSVQSAPNLDQRKFSGPKSDPFATIDKAKFLQTNKPAANKPLPAKPAPPQRPKSLYGSLPQTLPKSGPRPNSIYGSREVSPIPSNQSNHSLKDYLKQLSKSSENISTNITGEENDDTLHFLKDMEENGLGSSQNTGGSIKSSFKNGLRRISTGNSSSGVRSSNNTGNNYISNKRSSISSIKQLLTGGGSRKNSHNYEQEKEKEKVSRKNSYNYEREKEKDTEKPEPPKKLSIQRRMAQLLSSGEDTVKKTAEGYGRFTTNESDTDDIEAINNPSYKSKTLKPPKVPASLSSQRARSATPPSSSSTGTRQSKPEFLLNSKPLSSTTKPLNISRSRSPKKADPKSTTKSPVESPIKSPIKSPSTAKSTTTIKSPTVTSPKSLTKKPPPKPKKPSYLRTPDHDTISERRLSNSSEISLPDLDDLEKQFAKRFPSYV